jgi:hypothetical protein
MLALLCRKEEKSFMILKLCNVKEIGSDLHMSDQYMTYEDLTLPYSEDLTLPYSHIRSE